MSELIVLSFQSPTGAQEAQQTIAQLQKQNLIHLDDAATVVREQDGKPKVKQANNLVGEGALGGAFWGMLIGLLFFMPWLGLAAGALGGALGGKFADVGVDDDFIKQVGASIQPGQSALFLLIRDATPDRVIEAMKPHNPTIVHTSLNKEREDKLREAFGAEPAAATASAEPAAPAAPAAPPATS
jgi:uncharacterized membrane protein